MILDAIPSPDRGVLYLGPLPLRGYALMIILGIVAAVLIGDRRLVARGGEPGVVGDVAVYAVPAGIIGGRIYHLVTTPQPYFGAGGRPLDAFAIWKGGLGIWGAVALGALGAWYGCRRRGVSFWPFADAVMPGIALAQAIGRWGNWFNQELYGRPTDLPWAVRITKNPEVPGVELYHPTFLYEFLWLVALFGVLVWADRRFRLGHGRVFALYVVSYCLGRVWIEALRIDTANHILGLRLNIWTSLLVGLGGALLLYRRRGLTREDPAQVMGVGTGLAAGADQGASSGDGPVEDQDAERGAAEDSEAPEPGGETDGEETRLRVALREPADLEPTDVSEQQTRA